MTRLVSAVVLAMALSNPASAKTKPAPKPKLLPAVRYVCEDGTRLAVVRSAPGVTPETAVVRILGTDKELALARTSSADAGEFTAAGTTFVDKGATAVFTQAGAAALPCRFKR